MLRHSAAALFAALALAGCGQKSDERRPSGPPTTLITVTLAQTARLEVIEEAVGTLENLNDPRVGAEAAGRVVRVHVAPGQAVRRGQLLAEIDSQDQEIQMRADDADVGRLAALLANQERVVERQAQLVQKAFISQHALDDATSQRNALREQLAGARARADGGRSAHRKTRVLAPIDGRVEQQIVASGDFVKIGDPLFRLVGSQVLHAHLPFPESAATRIRVGMPVRLTSPLAPEKVIDARISEIRPTITESSRALDAIVRIAGGGSLIGGATVDARVISAVREGAVLVPEQSVVLRPAGKVVFIIAEGRAVQRVIETGYRRGGMIEVTRGLQGGETLALDGAGFLTDNAAVTLAQPRAARGENGRTPSTATKGPGAPAKAKTGT